jgi:hypothetical protein
MKSCYSRYGFFVLSICVAFFATGIRHIHAQVLYYDVYVGMKYSTDINQALLQLTGVSADGSTGLNEYAGTVSLSVTPHGVPGAMTTVYDSYCIGLFESVYVNQSYTGEPRLIPQPSDSIDPSRTLDNATRQASVIYTTFVADAAQSKEKGAALQAAIWKAMYTGFDFSGVNNNGSAYTAAQVTSFKTQVNTYYNVLAGANLDDHKYDANQWVFYNYNNTPKTQLNYQFLIGPVPEPKDAAWAALAALGAICSWEWSRRRRTKTAKAV